MQILTFLQDEISKDFGFADDDVIDSLKDCLEDLRRSHTETPPPLSRLFFYYSTRVTYVNGSVVISVTIEIKVHE